MASRPDLLPRFSTDRLAAERLDPSHLADLVALHGDAEVSRFLGGVRSAEATADYLAANLAHWDQYGFGLWVLRTADGAFAGRAGLRHLAIGGADGVELAYALARPFWGRGLASEIARALTEIGLVRFDLPSLIGVVAVAHGASRRVMEKTGFVEETRTRQRGNDVVIYRITQASPRPD